MKNFKKYTAIAVAATMTIGSAMTVFAGDVTPGVSEGEGSYEGGEMKYPTLTVTLPTIPAGTYDYIADPNGLIAATSGEKYANSTFTGDTGVFFLTSTADDGSKTYTENSEAQALTNENAQDIDVTVKLEQMAAGDSSIKYADSADFEDTDKENKLYLAITDGAATDPTVATLTSTGAATIKTTIAGVPENYEPGYTEGSGYAYTKKTTDLADWNDCSFKMTGALNKNATWGDDMEFPSIKVTWSYAEHSDSYLSTSEISSASNSVTVTLPSGVTVSKIELFKSGATTPVAMSAGSHYTKSGDTYTFTASMVSNWKNGSLKFTFSDNNVETIAIQ